VPQLANWLPKGNAHQVVIVLQRLAGMVGQQALPFAWIGPFAWIQQPFLKP